MQGSDRIYRAQHLALRLTDLIDLLQLVAARYLEIELTLTQGIESRFDAAPTRVLPCSETYQPK